MLANKIHLVNNGEQCLSIEDCGGVVDEVMCPQVPGLVFQFLAANAANIGVDRNGSPNGNSLLLQVEYSTVVLLFPGDLDDAIAKDRSNVKGLTEVYNAYEDNPNALSSDFVKVMHHGSSPTTDNSNNLTMLQWIGPQLSIVSGGLADTYWHPRIDTATNIGNIVTLTVDPHSFYTYDNTGQHNLVQWPASGKTSTKGILSNIPSAVGSTEPHPLLHVIIADGNDKTISSYTCEWPCPDNDATNQGVESQAAPIAPQTPLIVQSVSGCIDVNATTINCTIPRLLFLTVRGFNTSMSRGVVITIDKHAHCLYLNASTQSDPALTVLLCRLDAQFRSVLPTGRLLNISVYVSSTKQRSEPVPAVLVLRPAAPVLLSISGCPAHGCLPVNGSVTIMGSSFATLNSEWQLLVSGSLRGYSLDRDQQLNVSGGVLVVALMNHYLQTLRLEWYGTTVQLQLANAEQTSNALPLQLAPLPAPIVYEVQHACDASNSSFFIDCHLAVTLLTLLGDYFYPPLRQRAVRGLCGHQYERQRAASLRHGHLRRLSVSELVVGRSKDHVSTALHTSHEKSTSQCARAHRLAWSTSAPVRLLLSVAERSLCFPCCNVCCSAVLLSV